MPHIEDLLLIAIAQEGKTYLLGAEADAADPDPPKFDCSELVQYMCNRAEVVPVMPDGAFWQYRHCAQNNKLISVDQAIATRGALLFRETKSPPSKFDDVPHVAISLGDGMTVEARGRAWGVGSWGAAHRFQAAGLIPGVDYTPGHGQLPPPLPPQEKNDVNDRAVIWHDGHLWNFKRGDDAKVWVSIDRGGFLDAIPDGKIDSSPSVYIDDGGHLTVCGKGVGVDETWCSRFDGQLNHGGAWSKWFTV